MILVILIATVAIVAAVARRMKNLSDQNKNIYKSAERHKYEKK